MQAAAVYFFVSGFLVALLGSVFLAWLMLRPIRIMLYYQKLFINNLAHELRTPLSTIKTTTEVALLDDTLAAATKNTHADVLYEVETIADILKNLLFLNTATQPEYFKLQKIDLGPIIDSVVKDFAALAHDRKVKVVVQKDEKCLVQGNTVALETILSKLLKNALIYTPIGSDGTITISIKPYHFDSVVMSIADTGIGIAPEDIRHVFEPFYRTKNSRGGVHKKSGSGLGLTIVKMFVEAQNGRITIQSILNQGTVVSIFLPRGEPYSSVSPHAPPPTEEINKK
jgi:signal transduction histidine kinase